MHNAKKNHVTDLIFGLGGSSCVRGVFDAQKSSIALSFVRGSERVWGLRNGGKHRVPKKCLSRPRLAFSY